MRKWILWIILSGTLLAATASAAQRGPRRFFHTGDGILRLASQKNEKTFSGRYREADGRYRERALAAIAAVFEAPYDPGRRVISLRLIEYLDFLEDRLNPGTLLTLTSGYRAPAYNTRLRKRGGLAAKASLHQYGMAVDVIMEGVDAGALWEAVRKIGFGGAGYYHGKTVHVDVGPARYWDETTSGVGTGRSDDNKLIGVVTEYDVYLPGEPIVLRFIRMTAFPIGLRPDFRLIPVDGQPANGEAGGMAFRMPFAVPVVDGCAAFHDIDQMAAFGRQLPAILSPGRYRIRATFCDDRWDTMPSFVLTPPFEVRAP